MGAVLSAARYVLNLLLPFTNAKTPLLQDLAHTVILIGTLYFAPQIAEHLQSRQPPSTEDHRTVPTHDHGPAIEPPNPPLEDLPIDRNLVLQPDTDDGEDVEPPPLAPTPPSPGQIRPAPREPHDIPGAAGNFADPGPANANANANAAGPDRVRPTPANRTVGAKKAKSLARKDQRRAYHEFHRQEAELRRLKEAEGQAERDAALAAKKARRAEVEREIVEREREARERKKEEERREQHEERERRERMVERVKDCLDLDGAVNLEDMALLEGKDVVWVERLIRASGILSQSFADGSMTMITGENWVVRIEEQLLRQVYADAAAYGNANNGRISYRKLGDMLEESVRGRIETY